MPINSTKVLYLYYNYICNSLPNLLLYFLQSVDVILIITLAYLVAFPFSLLFEAPFINLDKLFLAPRSLKGQDKKDLHVNEKASTSAAHHPLPT